MPSHVVTNKKISPCPLFHPLTLPGSPDLMKVSHSYTWSYPFNFYHVSFSPKINWNKIPKIICKGLRKEERRSTNKNFQLICQNLFRCASTHYSSQIFWQIKIFSQILRFSHSYPLNRFWKKYIFINLISFLLPFQNCVLENLIYLWNLDFVFHVFFLFLGRI